VSDNEGYKAENHEATMTLIIEQRQVAEANNLYQHRPYEETTQSPMNQDGLAQLHICPTGHINLNKVYIVFDYFIQ